MPVLRALGLGPDAAPAAGPCCRALRFRLLQRAKTSASPSSAGAGAHAPPAAAKKRSSGGAAATPKGPLAALADNAVALAAVAAVDAAATKLPAEEDLGITFMPELSYQNRAPDEPPRRGEKPAPRGHPDCLTGKVFVVSGVLDSMTRGEAEDFIKRHGGKVGLGGGWEGAGWGWEGAGRCWVGLGGAGMGPGGTGWLGLLAGAGAGGSCGAAAQASCHASSVPQLASLAWALRSCRCRGTPTGSGPRGVQVTGSVSGRTSFLVTGTFCGKSKHAEVWRGAEEEGRGE